MPLRVLSSPVKPNFIAQCHKNPGHHHPKLFTQLSKQVNSHACALLMNAGADRCQIQSQGEQPAIPTSCFHWQSRPILTLNFKDSIKDASALCRTTLVITAKQKKSDLMSVLSRDQSFSKPYCLPDDLITKTDCFIQLSAVSCLVVFAPAHT